MLGYILIAGSCAMLFAAAVFCLHLGTKIGRIMRDGR